jgi:hypothetical protein
MGLGHGTRVHPDLELDQAPRRSRPPRVEDVRPGERSSAVEGDCPALPATGDGWVIPSMTDEYFSRVRS